MPNDKRKREELEKNKELLNKALETKELTSELQDEAKKVKENIEESASYKKGTKENNASERHEVELAAHAAKALEKNANPLHKLEKTLAKGAIAAVGSAVESAESLVQAAKHDLKGMHFKEEEQARHQRARVPAVSALEEMHQATSPVAMLKEPQHPKAPGERAAHQANEKAPKPEESDKPHL